MGRLATGGMGAGDAVLILVGVTLTASRRKGPDAGSGLPTCAPMVCAHQRGGAERSVVVREPTEPSVCCPWQSQLRVHAQHGRQLSAPGSSAQESPHRSLCVAGSPRQDHGRTEAARRACCCQQGEPCPSSAAPWLVSSSSPAPWPWLSRGQSAWTRRLTCARSLIAATRCNCPRRGCPCRRSAPGSILQPINLCQVPWPRTVPMPWPDQTAAEVRFSTQL